MKGVLDYRYLKEWIDALMAAHDMLECGVLARSILGREIPILTLGQGSDAVLYVGAHHGTEAATTEVLLDFAEEYMSLLARNAQIYGKRMKYIHEHSRIMIVPMLNPDGVEYATRGVGTENPLYDRVVAMNGGSDFSAWRANARGVDLCRNYNVDFETYKAREYEKGVPCGAPADYSGEFAESEPEIAALCRFLRRSREQIKGVISLHDTGERILCGCADKLSAKSLAVGRVLQRTTGYRLVSPTDHAVRGGLSHWCIERLGRPAYTLACGRSTMPRTKAERGLLYARLREALFTFPFML